MDFLPLAPIGAQGAAAVNRIRASINSSANLLNALTCCRTAREKVAMIDDDPLAQTILALSAEVGPGKSICPTDAAKAYARERGEDDLGWRSHLHQVRACAVGLARLGRLVIYRKGKPVDPDDFRGVYRLGLPRGE